MFCPDVESETPLSLLSRSDQEVVIPFCILTITISISEIPITKITGLNTVERKLEKEKSLNIPQLPVFGLKICINIRNGDQIINTRSNPILITLAITSKSSPIVKKNIIKNCNAKERVSFGNVVFVLSSMPIYV